jgi:xylan 1,4-beta-xylosidase
MRRSLCSLREILLTIALHSCSIAPSAAEATFTNPILPGGYPDPSICRVQDDFYVVNSTFEYFPALPIHHSRDLVNWELIGHAIDREEQASGRVNLVDVQSDGGIHAPSLRCRDNQFYVITTNVYQPAEPGLPTEMVNFVLTADNPSGPWSMPHVIEGAPGIDPDLFFDDDGTVWYLGNHAPADAAYPGEGEIWLQQLDTEHWSLIGERYFLWRGALKNAIWAEGPHLYKAYGRYYLLVAEGGTSFDHAVTIASSPTLTGPYIGNGRNPILTSRHLSYDHWVHSTGHADLVELQDGRWYMVALGVRGDIERGSNMGRETHLIPVQWELEPYVWKAEKIYWPVAAPLSGRVERVNLAPFPNARQQPVSVFVDEFDAPTLGMAWNFRRVPLANTVSLTDRPGFLSLSSSPNRPQNRERASLLGFRQTETDFEYQVAMHFMPRQLGAQAGINLFQKDDNYLAVTIVLEESNFFIQTELQSPNHSLQRVAREALTQFDGEIHFRIISRNGEYTVQYALKANDNWSDLTQVGGNHLISRGYTGAYLGLYAQCDSCGVPETSYFDRVEYRPLPR